MRYGLLGDAGGWWPQIEQVERQGKHRLVAVSPDPGDARLTGAERLAVWEQLLERPELEAVLVTDPADVNQLAAALRHLVQTGIPVGILISACPPLLAYEIELLRQDVAGIVLPWFPGRRHPALQQVRDWIHDGDASPLGVVSQIILEQSAAGLSADDVEARLVGDVALLRLLVGDIRNVSSVGVSGPDGRLHHQDVHMTAAGEIAVRWSLVPRPDAPRQLTVIGARTFVTLTCPASQAWWLASSDRTESREFAADNDIAPVLDDLQAAAEGQAAVTPDWSDACRNHELVEMADVSLRRKRTMDLHAGQYSEEYTFKGLMAASGCGILLLVLAGLVLLSLFEGFRLPLVGSLPDSREVARAPLWLRMWPVYPLVAFLALQFLLLVARRPRTSPAKPAPEPNGAGSRSAD